MPERVTPARLRRLVAARPANAENTDAERRAELLLKLAVMGERLRDAGVSPGDDPSAAIRKAVDLVDTEWGRLSSMLDDPDVTDNEIEIQLRALRIARLWVLLRRV